MGNTKTRIQSTFFDSDNYMLEEATPVYENKDLGVLEEGVCFKVTGMILLTCERFFINLLVGNEADDIALHLNARMPQNYIVRNSRVNNRWYAEQCASSLPLSLQRGKKFAIHVLITESAFLISVNGYHYATYLHCIPYTFITALTVKGEVTNVTMKHSVVSIYPERFDQLRVVEILQNKVLDAKSSKKTIYAQETAKGGKWNISIALRALHWPDELSTPYVARLPKAVMKPGQFLKIEGRVKLLPTSFYINLQRNVYLWPHPIVAFHFGPRFSNKSEHIAKAKIVRCAWYDGVWSQEELSDINTEFLPGAAFRLAIVCGQNAYEVYLNGKYLLEFKYHMLPEVVDTVYIRGDVKLRWVSMHSIAEDESVIKEYFAPKRKSTNPRLTYADSFSSVLRRSTYRPDE